jgi:hypothetical protein
MRAKNRPSAQSEQYRARVDVIQKQIRNCTDAICQGNSYPSLMEKLSELEQELADAKAKLANYSPGTIRIQLRETRRFVDFRFRYLQSVLDGEPRLARAEIMKHVQKITMTPEGKTYIASGNWDLLGSVAVRLVPGARYARHCHRLSSWLNWRRSPKKSIGVSVFEKTRSFESLL